MVIGAATTVYLIVKFVRGFFWILGKGMESCFREKYPYDFEINLNWVTSELKLRGFRQTALSLVRALSHSFIYLLANKQSTTTIAITVKNSIILLSLNIYSKVSCSHQKPNLA